MKKRKKKKQEICNIFCIVYVLFIKNYKSVKMHFYLIYQICY